MVESNVVLITGAGASCPYNFPTGADLMDEIIKGLRDPASAMTEAVQTAVPDCPPLRDLALRLADSERTSVDSFLQPECNAPYRQAARAAIAWVLLRREKRFDGPGEARPQDWMAYLFQALLEDAHEPTDLQYNRVTVLTFNFDCYLEYRWRSAIVQNFPQVSETEARRLAKASLEVHHINGALDDGLCKGEDGERVRVFGSGHVDSWYLRYFAPKLLFFHESSAMNRWESKLRNARAIVFLGFGFHAWNVRRLGFPSVLTGAKPEPALYASGLGLLQGERIVAGGRVTGASDYPLQFAGERDDCLATLRGFPILR